MDELTSNPYNNIEAAKEEVDQARAKNLEESSSKDLGGNQDANRITEPNKEVSMGEIDNRASNLSQ